MVFGRRNRVSRAEVEFWLKNHPGYEDLTEAEGKRVLFLVERMARSICRQKDKAVHLLPRLTDVWVSQVLSERADALVLKDFTKEHLDLSHKVRERERKSAAGLAELSGDLPRKRHTGGLPSQFKDLMIRARGAEEEAMAEGAWSHTTTGESQENAEAAGGF